MQYAPAGFGCPALRRALLLSAQSNGYRELPFPSGALETKITHYFVMCRKPLPPNPLAQRARGLEKSRLLKERGVGVRHRPQSGKLDLQKDFAGAFDGQLFHRAHAVAELRERRKLARTNVDQHREDRELQFLFALAHGREPFRRDLAFSAGDYDDTAALEFLALEQFDCGIDRCLKISAAAWKVFGHLEHFREFGLVAALVVQVQHPETLGTRGKQDRAKEPALAARDIHQGEAHRLGA